MSIIVKPHGDFVAGTTAEAAKVNNQFNTIYADHNGGLTDVNLNAIANIQQSKIFNLISDLNVIRGQKVQEATVGVFSASGIYSKLTDLLFAKIICIGGGGGGGHAASTGSTLVSSGGGGGSGAYTESWLLASSIGAAETVTIGQGGAAEANGGVTSFGALLTANGGLAGFGNPDSIGTAGSGGTAGGGQINIAGSPGGVGFITNAPFPVAAGGVGGAKGPYMTPGQAFPTGTSIAGGNGQLGGGGAGAASGGVNSALGGTGGGGLVIIWEFRA